MLDEIESGGLPCSAATRHRTEGAVLAMDAVGPGIVAVVQDEAEPRRPSPSDLIMLCEALAGATVTRSCDRVTR